MHGRSIRSWSLDSRLAAETSRLSFTGDTEQSVSLTYVKPRVQLTRKFGQHQLQMRVFRDVGPARLHRLRVHRAGSPTTSSMAAIRICGRRRHGRREVEGDLRFASDAALRVRAVPPLAR